MAAVNTFGDAEAIAIKHLRTDQTIAEARAFGTFPKDPVFPLLTLHRSGGVPVIDGAIDRAMVQVDAWAETKQEARYLASQAMASLSRLEGKQVSVLLDGEIEVGGYVTSVEVVQGLLWLPDSDTNRPRYLFQVALTIK